jgi:hypothetical protein
MTEPFADLTFERETGEVRGRGHAIALQRVVTPVMAALWRARGDVAPLVDQFGRGKAAYAVRVLRTELARFGLTVAGLNGQPGGHGLVDLTWERAKMTSETANDLPPSLQVTPNIPWERQTLAQLIAERDYWAAKVRTAAGFASAKAADDFRRGCETWIAKRQAGERATS